MKIPPPGGRTRRVKHLINRLVGCDALDWRGPAGTFRAIHRPTGHPVMLSFLTGPIIQDARRWAAAANDALAATRINSPHVQRFFEPVDLVSFKFLVSEDLRGGAADERLASGRF